MARHNMLRLDLEGYHSDGPFHDCNIVCQVWLDEDTVHRIELAHAALVMLPGSYDVTLWCACHFLNQRGNTLTVLSTDSEQVIIYRDGTAKFTAYEFNTDDKVWSDLVDISHMRRLRDEKNRQRPLRQGAA
jgi:hypothetical protein